DFDAATEPNHVEAGFPTGCVTCHGDQATTWEGAEFDHSSFPLQGRHQTAACADCHTNGVYQGLASDCVSCHRREYDQTTDPNHAAAGFPTDCTTCHGTQATTWEGAQFDHSSFPINSGAHRGLACSDCHLSSNYLQFSCIDCHEHDRASTDRHHREVGGYVYESQACYSCHPNGRGD
ncbi:MAG: cytochrome c3 family protein, partial [Acidobacteriota bacterium]